MTSPIAKEPQSSPPPRAGATDGGHKGDTSKELVRFYWQRHADGQGAWRRDSAYGPPGEELAALRRGIGREPGSVPQIWRYYTTLSPDGALTSALRAEHLALTLYAVHQQSQRRPMHREGIGLGEAVRQLRASGKFSAEAVDRRFDAAATATTLTEAAVHLRGLITQLRGLEAPQPLDYTRLFRDLRDWQDASRVGRVRRRWGSQYFLRPSESQASLSPTGTTPTR